MRKISSFEQKYDIVIAKGGELMQYQNGEEFLNYLNKNMHLEDIVMHTAEKVIPR